jgi:chaperonin cofactor prefoldin
VAFWTNYVMFFFLTKFSPWLQVGPVLIKNDLDEAIETVKKRLEFITGEM